VDKLAAEAGKAAEKQFSLAQTAADRRGRHGAGGGTFAAAANRTAERRRPPAASAATASLSGGGDGGVDLLGCVLPPGAAHTW